MNTSRRIERRGPVGLAWMLGLAVAMGQPAAAQAGSEEARASPQGTRASAKRIKDARARTAAQGAPAGGDGGLAGAVKSSRGDLRRGRGRVSGPEDRQALARDIAMASAAGARLHPASEVAGNLLRRAGRQAIVLAPSRQRRQRRRREPVPHRQVPPGVPGQGLRRSRPSQGTGGRVPALAQPRSLPQRHPVRRPGAAPRRPGPYRPGRPAGPPPQGPAAQPSALVRQHPQLVARRPRRARS